MSEDRAEGNRAMALQKERERMLADFQLQKEKIKKDSEIKIGSDKFVSQSDQIQAELVKHTVERLKRKKDNKAKAKLSFAADDDAEEETEDIAEIKKIKTKKNPLVDTSFLPDKEREEMEKREREMLKLQWLKEQEKVKAEKILITYSYWDGTGHRKQIECKKGDTIGQFLEAVRLSLPELRAINVDNLMYIKEDLIIPHTFTFYDFIINQTRGKSGPLFAFDVHDDVRLVNDARVETEESHAGKVVQRSWYEKNKHIFPASRWELFDPSKTFEKYTIKG
ncbi:XAP5, circadian clock regulator-domain-containing protein [Zopfochytrium polystomum]|nr:XAP5, circadian clock regulator-domain-containing protein [Zopfochytrium polystomum]